jgi:ribosomal-protein-alanine N-acetyltransferase
MKSGSLKPVVCRLSAQSVHDLVSIESESNTPPWSEKLFSKEFDNPHSFVFGARFRGVLVGFLVAHVITDEAHIVNFGVRASERGKNFGKTLLKEALTDLYWRGVRWVTLEVRRSNAVARGLYESLGFYEVGVRESYYFNNLEDAIVMSLNIRQFMDEQLVAQKSLYHLNGEIKIESSEKKDSSAFAPEILDRDMSRPTFQGRASKNLLI